MTTDPDRRAADPIRTHHDELHEAVRRRVEALILAADAGRGVDDARRAVLDVLDGEIIPHAKAEEAALYPAGDTPTAALLVRAMREEHRALIGRVDRLRDATAPAVAAGHAAAVLALLESHLWKENELLVPAILGDPSTSLAELLAGMHELIG